MFAGQLTIFDEFDRFHELDRDRDGLRRLGDGPELGMALLQPLFARGWQLHRVVPFAGEPGWLFILENGVFEAKQTGSTLGDVAVELFKEAAVLTGAAA